MDDKVYRSYLRAGYPTTVALKMAMKPNAIRADEPAPCEAEDETMET